MLSSTGGAWHTGSVRRMVTLAYPKPADANEILRVVRRYLSPGREAS